MELFSCLLRFYFIADNDIHIPGYAGDSSTTHKTVHRQKTRYLSRQSEKSQLNLNEMNNQLRLSRTRGGLSIMKLAIA